MSHSASPDAHVYNWKKPRTTATHLFFFVGETIAECGLSKLATGFCRSDGKGSYALLDLLLVMQRHAPIHFDLVRQTWIRNSRFPAPLS